MEKVTAEALKSNFSFTQGTEIRRIERIQDHRIERFQDTLKVYVRGWPGESGCLVTFENPIGFRAVDERDLLEYWPECSTPAGWLFQILSGGWLDQERKRPGSLIETHSDAKEYLIAGMHDCVSVFSDEPPTLTEWSCAHFT